MAFWRGLAAGPTHPPSHHRLWGGEAMCQPAPHPPPHCRLFPLKDSYRALGTGFPDCSQHNLLKPLAFPELWNVLQRRLGPGIYSAAAPRGLVMQTGFCSDSEQNIPGKGPGLAKTRAVAWHTLLSETPACSCSWLQNASETPATVAQEPLPGSPGP